MPDRKTHQYVGLGAGALYAAYRAKEQTSQNWFIEVTGGALGGYLGGLLPDVLEPATSSWHRGTGHSYAAGGTIIYFNSKLTQWETAFRERAEQCRAIRMAPDPYSQGNVFVPVPADPLAELISKIAELLWRFLAGFLNGLTIGYASHLAFDAATARSIPLLTTGF